MYLKIDRKGVDILAQLHDVQEDLQEGIFEIIGDWVVSCDQVGGKEEKKPSTEEEKKPSIENTFENMLKTAFDAKEPSYNSLFESFGKVFENIDTSFMNDILSANGRETADVLSKILRPTKEKCQENCNLDSDKKATSAKSDDYVDISESLDTIKFN
jgi:hypothetical protein